MVAVRCDPDLLGVYLLGPDLSEGAREKIRKADALKMLFLKDDYRDVRS